MNKNEIKKFLELEEVKTINNIKQERNKELENLKEKASNEALKGLNLNEIEVDAKLLLNKFKQIEIYLEKNTIYTCDAAHAIKASEYLESMINTGFEKDIKESINARWRETSQPEINYKKQKEQIRDEYTKLKGNISAMTGVQATEYLKELGFKIPEINIVKNEVMSPINISLLKELRGEI